MASLASNTNGYYEFIQGLLVALTLVVAFTGLVPDLARWAGEVLSAHSIAMRNFWRLAREACRMYWDSYRAEREWDLGQRGTNPSRSTVVIGREPRD